jgi:hypothetical protein
MAAIDSADLGSHAEKYRFEDLWVPSLPTDGTNSTVNNSDAPPSVGRTD